MKKLIPAVLVFALTVWSQTIFAQDTDSYSKVANHLVELINAADYPGVETLFNKGMSNALPLTKATPFFVEMKRQFGKLQKLDEPKRTAGWTVFSAHFERGLMDMSLVLDGEGKIAGLNFKPRAASPAATSKKPEESPTKVANRLVELINAADYAGVEKLFNQDVSKALPLKELTEFLMEFTGQVGKIQKLEAPKRSAEGSIFPVQCERGVLDMSLALDDEGKIAGLEFKPRAASPEAAPKK